MKSNTNSKGQDTSGYSLPADVVRIAAFALAYFLAHWISFYFPDSQKILMAVWPAGGIGLAALLLSPRRQWPALCAALFASGILADAFGGRPLAICLGFMTANILESLGSAWVITKFCGDTVTFTRVREVGVLACAAAGVNAVTALIGAGTAAFASHALFWHFWKSWWISDGLGLLLIAPLIISWKDAKSNFATTPWGSRLEWVAFFVVWTALVGFSSQFLVLRLAGAAPYVFVALMAWPALRFGQMSVTTALTILASFLIIGTIGGHGPFIIGGVNPSDSLMHAQMYIAFLSVTGLLLAASYLERKRAENSLQHSEMLFRNIFEQHTVPMLLVNPESGAIVDANPAAWQVYGWTQEHLRSMNVGDVNPLSPEEVKLNMQNAKTRKRTHFEFQHRLANGELRDVDVSSSRIELKGEVFLHSIIHDVSDKKQAEQELRESEEKFRTLADLLPALVCEVDSRGILKYVNKFGFTLTGYSQEDFDKGLPALALIAERDRSTAAENVQRMMQGLTNDTQEYTAVTKNGREFSILVTSSRIVQDGLPVGFRSVILDVTDRKKAEEALRASEQKYRDLFNNSEVGMFRTRIDSSEMVDFNDKFLQILGRTREEIKDTFALSFWADPNERAEIVRRIIDTGGVRDYENKIIDNRGNIRDCLTSVRFLRDEGILEGSMIDITDRKKAEHALQESEFFFKEAQRAASIGSYKTDFISGFWESSEVLDQIFGIDKNYVRSVSGWLDIVHPDDRARMDAYLQEEVFSKRKPFDMQYRIVRKSDGKVRWVNGLGKISWDANDKVVSMTGTIQDITESKQNEIALQNVQKLDAVGTLAGGIAHDFNNLLGGIFGYIDLANTATTEKSVSTYLSKAINSIERARGLTRQLLTFARGGAPERVTRALPDFLRETVQFALSGSNVSCGFEIAQNLWTADIDKNQIAQVIDNIVINAQQAMPLGGTISVSAANLDIGNNEQLPLARGKYVRLSFTDSGVGIPADILPRIFDPFFTTKSKGHGLGLATCFSIIKRHDGVIQARSEPGNGSTFDIYLPASSGAAEQKTSEPGAAHAGGGAILVMDDEEVMRDSVGEMLKKFGYSPEFATNGTDALRMISRRDKSGSPFAAIILDLTIPGGLGGRETISELRERGINVPAFVFSGYAEDPIMARPRDFGFTASIRKPFKKSELGEMLEKYLGKQKSSS